MSLPCPALLALANDGDIQANVFSSYSPKNGNFRSPGAIGILEQESTLVEVTS
jgi:hypothetical protein